MIQRIQSVFLLLAIVCSVLLFALPSQIYISGLENATWAYTCLPFHLPVNTTPVIYGLFVANLAMLAFSLVAVFQYKNRKKQLRKGRLIILFAVIYMGQAFVFNLNSTPDVLRSFTWVSYLPIGSMLFALLAGVFIKRDEDLVRSADRIR